MLYNYEAIIVFTIIFELSGLKCIDSSLDHTLISTAALQSTVEVMFTYT